MISKIQRLSVAAALGLLATTSLLHADDWPQWLGSKRDGIWREKGIINKFPAGGPKVVWRAPLGAGYTGPAVADGKVFLMDRVTPTGKPGPEGTERVVCLDEKTGKELWKHEYDCTYRIAYNAGPRCTPTVDGDRVYTLGAMGDLRCLDVAKGTLLWSKNFVKDYNAPIQTWGFASHPLVDGDRLICLTGGSDDRLVVAFDKKTGKEIWASQSSGGSFGYSPPVIYEFGDRRQLIIWHSKAVVGLEPQTGKRLWKVDFEVKADLTAPMPRKVGEDGLFVTSFYNGSMLLKVDADKAVVVWRSMAKGERPDQTTDLSSIIPTPVVDGKFIYGICSYGQLRCIEATTGKRVWETMKATRGEDTPPKVAAEPTPAPSERWSNAFLIPHGDRYFIFNEQGDLIIAKLSPEGYEEIDRARIIEPTNGQAGRGRKVVWVHPAFANQCIFVRNDKEAVCLSLASAADSGR